MEPTKFITKRGYELYVDGNDLYLQCWNGKASTAGYISDDGMLVCENFYLSGKLADAWIEYTLKTPSVLKRRTVCFKDRLKQLIELILENLKLKF